MQTSVVTIGSHAATSTGTSTTTTTTTSRRDSRQGSWRCGNCPKNFAQKEYRDKHQRRCIQASSRQKLSKQKSCVACASSKLGCDQATPSCSRCIHRNIHCQYVSALAADGQKRQQDQQAAQKNANRRLSQQREQQPVQSSDGSPAQFLYLSGEPHPSLEENIATRDIRSTGTSPELDPMRVANGSAHSGTAGNVMPLSTPSPTGHHHPSAPASNIGIGSWHVESPPITRSESLSDQLSGGPLRDAGMSLDWFRQNIYPFSAAGSESGESVSHWQRSRLSPSRGNPFMPSDGALSAEMDYVNDGAMTGISNDDLNFDLLGSLGILTQNQVSTPNAQQSPLSALLRPPTAATTSGAGMPPPLRSMPSHSHSPSSTDEELSAKESLHDAVKMATGGGSSLSGKFEDHGWQRCPFHKLNTADELVRTICNYPRIMVRPGEYPPFVHHKLYRCATGEVSEPLARAFCCVGAFYASVPTSETFVYSMINEESRKLIDLFHKWSGSDSDMLAVIHAMCIYQILGFFASSSPAQAQLSEMLHLYFLKMTRRLIQQHLLPPSTDEVTDEVSWRRWIMKETIRRTVFLVNTINTLSCRIQKQNPYYFEPLDDHLVRNTTLPAPESLWKASSAEEWIAAKAQLGPEEAARSCLTVQQVVDQFMSENDPNDHQNHDICRVKYEQFDAFTRLILATASNS
ncbi:hypothetical protein M440DRAFT_1468608 [Trichoderma longibrachiatum ATCC 18648]|uniref:Zn(2)-C6 fungal-type domain-containing protein n=1 Tax=Trichoderma longibrachiatum ATCC 18648 TaxID=983965 RepID=A0A2T4C934_TRILO|nr:hypothetical protein M440DRAFT_1468608 [Trichoderma longibrachiatum ATCC 18648]